MSMENATVAIRLSQVLEKIRDAEQKAGRAHGGARLLAVSKFHAQESVAVAYAAGQKFFGENRVQEAVQKFTSLAQTFPDISLHIIGTLQTNKVRHAVEIADCIESVDRISLIEEIEKQCAKKNKSIEVYFELHTGEESKAGFENIDELEKALLFCAEGKASHIIPRGFMTMAPFTKDEKIIRQSFSTLRNVSEKMKEHFPDFNLSELSMGMSNDYEIAIEEGSTEVRIGTAIFGERF